jgi:hypothetical protein
MADEPRKIGFGEFRHCYPGQEANLLAELRKKNLSLEDFNRFWDHIEERNRDHKFSEDEKNTEYRQEIARRLSRQLNDAFMAPEDEPFNLFVPTFAPRYQEMVDHGGKPGVSLEDASRNGVWIPRSWWRK